MEAPHQHNFFTAFVQGLTLGMVNYSTGKLIIKDPITGFFNSFKQAKDSTMANFNEGVWIGKRVLKDSSWGFSSFLT
jgi:hypothetical protein